MESPHFSNLERARSASGSSNRLLMDAQAETGRSNRASWPPTPDSNESASSGYGAYGGYPAAAMHGEPGHFLDYVRVVYRRRYTAITAFLVILVAVVVYTYTRTPIYQASAQIQIDYENQKVVPFQEVTQREIGWDTSEYYQTQYKILQSRTLARRTLDSANLWTHPLLAGVGRGFSPANVARGSADAAQGSDVARGFSPANTSPLPEPPSQSAAIDSLLDGLTISPIRNSRLVDVVFSSPDPQLAAVVANALANAYIQQDLDLRLESSRQASDFLKQQLDQQKEVVETSEQELQHYREKTDSVSLEDKQNITSQKLADLNGAVTRAKTERLQKEAIYNQVKAIQNDRAALDTFPAILASSFIQQLKAQAADLQRQRASLNEKYGEKHPEMIRLSRQLEQTDAKIQIEIGKVVQSIRNEYEAALAQERSLVEALDQQKTEALALGGKGIRYGTLQRNATTNREMYDSLLQRAKETQVGAEMKSSNIRVVDAAIVPDSPVSPNKSRNLLFAIFGGGIFAIGLAFFFEYLDNRVKSPDEIKHYLGLPFLGLVPALTQKGFEAEDALLHNTVPSGFAEAFRTIRTNILFSSTEEGGRSIVVTSTAPAEGKTLVATNLSVALAQAGQRVLLVDADMRKPRVHSVLGLEQVPGLSNVLVGNAKASQAVRKGPIENLYVLPAGVTPPNPSEFLGFDALPRLPRHAGRELRVRGHRLAARDGRNRCFSHRPRRQRCRLRGRLRADEQARRLHRARPTRGSESEVRRRHPQPRERPAESVLLLALLSEVLRGLLSAADVGLRRGLEWSLGFGGSRDQLQRASAEQLVWEGASPPAEGHSRRRRGSGLAGASSRSEVDCQ